jgi:hypothetical protein
LWLDTHRTAVALGTAVLLAASWWRLSRRRDAVEYGRSVKRLG